MPKKSISILGATGTIGQNTFKLIRAHGGFEVEAITAHHRVKPLAEAAKIFKPKMVAIADESRYTELKEAIRDENIEVAAGDDAIIEASSRPVDILMEGIVGAAALAPTLAAIRQGTTIGLANKECLVCAGDLMTAEADKYNAKIIPVDSEHNAIYQAFDFDHADRVEKITLTASGGPFRHLSAEAMAKVTPQQAVKHPNWNMGAKISVDSATMMNKGLEMIEAYHLFPVLKQQVTAIIHPESVIHGLVYYSDGAVMAGLSIPDMCVPIAFALGWPDRMMTSTRRPDLAALGSLTFEQPDEKKFPALKLAKNALYQGGTAPCILNAANEIAVQAFLDEKIGFQAIAHVVETTLERLASASLVSLDQVFSTDQEARKIAENIIDSL